MTVIAYKDGIMASDGLVTDGPVIVDTQCDKIMRLENGGLFGMAGDLDCRDVVEVINYGWTKEAPSRDTLAELAMSFEGIVVRPDGTVYTVAISYLKDYERWDAELIERKDKVATVGCGSPFALTAMTLGKSAVEAVDTAMKLHTHCGGCVSVHLLDQKAPELEKLPDLPKIKGTRSRRAA